MVPPMVYTIVNIVLARPLHKGPKGGASFPPANLNNITAIINSYNIHGTISIIIIVIGISRMKFVIDLITIVNIVLARPLQKGPKGGVSCPPCP